VSGPDPRAQAWVAAGAASLTGTADGPGLVPPAPLLARVAQLGGAAGVDPFATLIERAAIAGLRRNGPVSCGSGARLLPALDGWLAVSLVRPDDVAAVAAWLELDRDPGADPWPVVAATVADRPVDEVVARAVLLGLPAAAVGEAGRPTAPTAPAGEERAAVPGGPAGSETVPPVRWTALGTPERDAGVAPAAGAATQPPLVVDLSSLWAGPVCARALGAGGAVVVKVESTSRPDGARRGPAAFYDRLHGGHLSVALDLTTAAGRADLRLLVGAADVVIEASRPRALAQLGIAPDDLDAGGPRAWVSITAHGRTGAGAHRVGFGDDAAAAGGLVAPTTRGPVFVADAVADPLTGMAAAAAARLALRDGGRWLLDVPLSRVAAWVAGDDEPDDPAWREIADPPPPPPPPGPRRPAPALGADTATVVAALRDGRPHDGHPLVP
jgi:hypothetical protein